MGMRYQDIRTSQLKSYDVGQDIRIYGHLHCCRCQGWYITCRAAAPLRPHWPLPRGSNCSSLLVLHPFGGSVHSRNNLNSWYPRKLYLSRTSRMVVSDRLPAWVRVTVPQANLLGKLQYNRNNLNVILETSASHCDKYIRPTQSESVLVPAQRPEGKSLLLVCIQQGLVCQFSASELWLPPLWDHPLARSCAGKRMRTRIKKATWRGDAIAGNIKLFAGAAVGRILK